MPVPPRVIELVDTFGRNCEAYRSDRYNEAQLRREFVDPFFKALGWDVENEIAMTDWEINQMVYELYGPTDEDIRIVEGPAGDASR